MDRLVKQVIKEHLQDWDGFSWTDENIAQRELNNWKHKTRIMFRTYPAAILYEIIDEACYLASEDGQKWLEEYYKKGYPEEEKETHKDFKRNIKFIKGWNLKTIDANLKISSLAKDMGFEIKYKKIICPFHDDKEPSCLLDDKTNTFYCFGCHAKGDIVEFYRRLNERGKIENGKH